MVNVASLFTAAAIAAIALAPSADAHAQQLTEAQIAQRRLLASSAKHALGDCAQSESYRKLQERAVQRRQAAMNRARRERRLALDDFLAINHESSLDVTASTDSSVLFGDEVSCILQPEVTYGPYYIKGEHIRTDVRETQVGIDFYFDLQVIDVDTCEPVENMYMDFWHANSSGVYAGVVAEGNGAGTSDPSNVNATFLRGVYPTDSDGVVQFISKFPGHYVERATHIHLLANYGGTVLENGTYSGGYIPHVAQFFFDQDLLTSVYATSAYENDTAEITLNEDDMWLQTASVDDFDSLVEYALLGDSVEDGIFGWISVAMNMSASQTVSPAGYLTASGGVLSSTSTTTGGGGSGMGGGSMGGFGGSMGGGDFGGSFVGGSFAGGDAPAAGVSGSTDSETTGTVTTSSVASDADVSVACSVSS